MNLLAETQAMSLSFEVWFLIAMVAGLTAYGVRIVTGLATSLLLTLLTFGAFAGNVAARAFQIIPATNVIPPDIVVQSSYACFAGMLAVMTVWFVCKLVVPAMTPQRTLRRAHEPKPVIGNTF